MKPQKTKLTFDVFKQSCLYFSFVSLKQLSDSKYLSPSVSTSGSCECGKRKSISKFQDFRKVHRKNMVPQDADSNQHYDLGLRFRVELYHCNIVNILFKTSCWIKILISSYLTLYLINNDKIIFFLYQMQFSRLCFQIWDPGGNHNKKSSREWKYWKPLSNYSKEVIKENVTTKNLFQSCLWSENFKATWKTSNRRFVNYDIPM